MKYKAISADGHVNEPPDLWTSRLPAKFKDRGPHVIETPNTHGDAWIMEGQTRPSPMGGSSVNYRGQRFDRKTLGDKFLTVKNRGVRYEDIFPGSWDPQARVKEMTEDHTDAEVMFNGVQTVWNALKLCKDHELALACYKVYNDWITEFQEAAPERFICNGTLPTTGIDDCIEEMHRCAKMGLRTVQLEAYPSGDFKNPSAEDDRFWAAAVEIGMPVNVHTQFFFNTGDLGGNVGRADDEVMSKLKAKNLFGLDVEAGRFPSILGRMIGSGVFERFPDLNFVGTEVQIGWVPYFLQQYDESVIRNRQDWKLSMLPSEYFRRNVTGLHRRRGWRRQPVRHRCRQDHVGP